MKKLPIKAVLIIISLALIFALVYKNTREENNYKVLRINDKELTVEIAGSQQVKQKGLSTRNSMPKDQGMLFVFDSDGSYPFWMKDMMFDLDFIFIKDGSVVEIIENITHPLSGEEPKVIKSQAVFDSVLEVNAGIVNNYSIKIGDKVSIR